MWRKSRHSNSQGACVEVASYRKSSYSSNPANTCVEVGAGSRVVGVRDTTQESDPSRTVIEVSARVWREFAASLK